MNKIIKPYTWIVRLDVAPMWVADGFNMSDERALEMLGKTLGYANMTYELAATVISAPSSKRIVQEFGYKAHASDPIGIKEWNEVLKGSPTAYIGHKELNGRTVDDILTDAIKLLNSVAFVSHEKDNTQAVVAELTAVQSLMRGDTPISEIEWEPAEGTMNDEP